MPQSSALAGPTSRSSRSPGPSRLVRAGCPDRAGWPRRAGFRKYGACTRDRSTSVRSRARARRASTASHAARGAPGPPAGCRRWVPGLPPRPPSICSLALGARERSNRGARASSPPSIPVLELLVLIVCAAGAGSNATKVSMLAPAAPPVPQAAPPGPPTGQLRFGNVTSNPTLFTHGMILQRGGARVWGTGAVPSATVTVPALGEAATVTAVAVAKVQASLSPSGDWMAVVNAAAAKSATLKASDGTHTATLRDVAIGDVVLCGGQSNSAYSVPAAALTTLD
eukprot:SAG22_NODE_159_length_16948_cov_14.480503_17_plen_283_part_00